MNSQFNPSVFQKKLQTQWLGRSLCYFNELESTNSYLKKITDEEVEQGMICLTDKQGRGRGQYEREWESEPRQNLTFSMAFIPSLAERFHILTLACALALAEHLDEFIEGSDVYIKWPNDVIVNNRKIAGVLTETMFSGNHVDRLIIGIGLNVNQEKFSEELQKKATSVCLECGKQVNRESFLCNVLNRIEHRYNLWHRQQPDLLKSINQNIRGYGQWVGLEVNDKLREDTYKFLGIDESGKLLVLDQDGGIETFSYEQIRLIAD